MTSPCICKMRGNGDFNSHAHVERDDNALIFRTQNAISTHTLTWSVTSCSNCCCKILIISTHTLTWSVTCRYGASCIYTTDISTHTLTWSVTFAFCVISSALRISTHTLTWSVTPEIRKTGLKTFYFNSHAHVERDNNGFYCYVVEYISTHTLTWSVTSMLIS